MLPVEGRLPVPVPVEGRLRLDLLVVVDTRPAYPGGLSFDSRDTVVPTAADGTPALAAARSLASAISFAVFGSLKPPCTMGSCFNSFIAASEV